MRTTLFILPVLMLVPACTQGYSAFSPPEGVEYTLYPAELDGFGTPDTRNLEGEVITYGEPGSYWSPYAARWQEEIWSEPEDGRYYLNLYAFDEGPYNSTLAGRQYAYYSNG